MTTHRDRVSAATAAVLVDDRRVGSAVLLDGGYLITAGHVMASRRGAPARR